MGAADTSSGNDRPLMLDGIAALRALVGRPARLGPWLRIDQAMIDRFADATLDHQWIHVDTERSARESPHGRTIAHGLLSLALLPHLLAQLFSYPGRKTSINYGFDRIRFTSAVPDGSQVRAAVALAELTPIGEQEGRLAWDVTLELAGQPRPALVARWLVQMRW